MALWISDVNGEQYDDGLTLKPGEEGFSRALAEAHFGNKKFSYSGTPNWTPPKIEQAPEDAA